MINTTFGIVFDEIDKIISNLSVGNEHQLMEHWNEIKLMESYDFDRICSGANFANPVVSAALNYGGNSASLVYGLGNDVIFGRQVPPSKAKSRYGNVNLSSVLDVLIYMVWRCRHISCLSDESKNNPIHLLVSPAMEIVVDDGNCSGAGEFVSTESRRRLSLCLMFLSMLAPYYVSYVTAGSIVMARVRSFYNKDKIHNSICTKIGCTFLRLFVMLYMTPFGLIHLFLIDISIMIWVLYTNIIFVSCLKYHLMIMYLKDYSD